MTRPIQKTKYEQNKNTIISNNIKFLKTGRFYEEGELNSDIEKIESYF